MSSSSHSILVIIGTGGMGVATAHRLASGRQLLLADNRTDQLQKAADNLRQAGHEPETLQVNISDRASVAKLAEKASQMGRVDAIVHTAGVSPVMAPAKVIYEVDIAGTANLISEFLPFASRGTSMVCVASMAAQMASISSVSPELETHFAMAETDKLLEHSELDFEVDSQIAYSIAKKANILRVQTAASQWGSKGARINTVSPGVIYTDMVRQELEGKVGDQLRQMLSVTPINRIGTPDDVASAIAFLIGPESSFIAGNDLLVDGGVSQALRWSA